MKRILVSGLAAATLGLTASAQDGVASFGVASSAQPTPVGLRSPTSQPAVLGAALRAAHRGDVAAARARQSSLHDPVEIALVDWALSTVAARRLSLAELEAAERRLRGWPGEDARVRTLAARRGEAGATPAEGRRAPAGDYRQRRLRMSAALQRGDARAAYVAVVGHVQRPGSVAYAELESFAGWLALTRLGDPAAAERHFARLDAAVRSPVSKARAAYWRGRAAEAAGDPIGALQFYARGAAYKTTFYGQLAAEKAGVEALVLPADPKPDGAARAAFRSSELTRALHRLSAAGERGLLKQFALQLGDRAASAAELALLVDELRRLGEQETALLAYRRGARHGHVLFERGYPIVSLPSVAGGADPALVLAVTRQESQFDPRVRSGADARGMMQLLPGTGRQVAGRLGMAWSDALLWDATANMRLGSRYLGDLSARFGGSYVLAVAGYNAGPGRPGNWVSYCGDPRAPGIDPVDFIECIPFGETRDYVMNVLANYQVYRARLAGGRAELRAEQALRAPGGERQETD
ncbi:transglycosylase SLT domain-containing protein [Phenylobacterium sp.]|uniref:transglycosylase SLT domain-containing protein n=1 Tax=Phenylobacterium sp. TaxID=1871053 RepID=UPI0035B2449A